MLLPIGLLLGSHLAAKGSSEKVAFKSYHRKVVGEGALAARYFPGTVDAMPDPLSQQTPRPKVPGLYTPRRPTAKLRPADLGRQKGTTPTNPFSGNKVNLAKVVQASARKF